MARGEKKADKLPATLLADYKKAAAVLLENNSAIAELTAKIARAEQVYADDKEDLGVI